MLAGGHSCIYDEELGYLADIRGVEFRTRETVSGAASLVLAALDRLGQVQVQYRGIWVDDVNPISQAVDLGGCLIPGLRCLSIELLSIQVSAMRVLASLSWVADE
jgi:hypothetical protein